MTFEILEHFAETWGLAYMVLLFAGIVVFLLRPRARQSASEASQIPFNEDIVEEHRS